MRSVRLLVLVALSLTLPALSADKSSSLLTNLNNEFLNHSFRTKIVVGKYTTSATTNQQMHYVDTEILPDGGIRYLARGFWPAVHIAPVALTASFSKGAEVWICRIELKDDRIEFTASGSDSPNNLANEPKLKFMLGKGYESWDYPRIEAVISHVLAIERLEKLAQLQADYADLQRQLAEAKTAGSAIPAKDLDAQIANKQRLHDLYAKLAANRMGMAGVDQGDSESAGFSKSEAEVGVELQTLTAERSAQQKAQLAQAATALRQTYIVAKQQIRSTKNLQQRRDNIDQAKSALDTLKNNYLAQERLDSPMTADLSWVSDEERSLNAMTADLPNLEARQRLNELDAQYKVLEQKRSTLQTAYVNAGTEDKQVAAIALKKQLQMMYDNRIAADHAGSKTAAKQAAGLQLVIGHLE